MFLKVIVFVSLAAVLLVNAQDPCVQQSCPEGITAEPIYLPYVMDCNQYVQCQNGESHIRPCSAGLHFNPTLLVCDHAISAGCVQCGVVTETTPTAPTVATSTTTPEPIPESTPADF